jgi:hypothetical protein
MGLISVIGSLNMDLIVRAAKMQARRWRAAIFT